MSNQLTGNTTGCVLIVADVSGTSRARKIRRDANHRRPKLHKSSHCLVHRRVLARDQYQSIKIRSSFLDLAREGNRIEVAGQGIVIFDFYARQGAIDLYCRALHRLIESLARVAEQSDVQIHPCVLGVCQFAQSCIDPFAGLFAHSGTVVQDPIYGCHANTRQVCDLTNRRPLPTLLGALDHVALFPVDVFRIIANTKC